jgi:DNA-binding PadR family transcriptional regulator
MIYLKQEIEVFEMRHSHSHDDDRWAAGRHGRWRHRHGSGGGRRGMGGDDMMRAGRMLAHGDLRLLALALIAEQPRHGYEIIKVLEDKTEGWYAPSPGVVYPTLTYLEEAGYVTAEVSGAKKLYTITAEGTAYLQANRAFVDAVLERLEGVGERAGRMRQRFEGDQRDNDRPRVSRLVQAALDNLREVAAERLAADEDAEAKVVEALARAAADLRRV